MHQKLKWKLELLLYQLTEIKLEYLKYWNKNKINIMIIIIITYKSKKIINIAMMHKHIKWILLKIIYIYIY